MTAAPEGGEWSAARPGRTLLPGKTRYRFYRRLDGPQGRSGRAGNLVPTGIPSQTVQPVAQSLHRLNYPAHAYLSYKKDKINEYPYHVKYFRVYLYFITKQVTSRNKTSIKWLYYPFIPCTFLRSIHKSTHRTLTYCDCKIFGKHFI